MSEWICDDRETAEEKYDRWKKIHDMSDEEFEEYLKTLNQNDGKELDHRSTGGRKEAGDEILHD